MNHRIIQLVEDLHREVNKTDLIENNTDSLNLENENLKKQLADSKQTIFELTNKIEELAQENVIIKTHKQKLKLVVVKLKHKLESKNSDNLNSNKSKKTIKKKVSQTNDVIIINEDSNKNLELDDSISTQEDVTMIHVDTIPEKHTISPPNKVQTILEKTSTLNPRKKEDRAKMDTKPCEECSKWYGDAFEHMKDTCRHRYHVIPPTTPERFWDVKIFPPPDL
ncbi:DNA endonuclease RBBP8 [Oopsacas minuta]|uniref:DNA endonuclease RBBP8 n=1 Tax=Oopsacas minuta TaxID=111878 RepID=A0AAV7K884_9METZ|nr:DNA endonuclease RBBP8 [Oopsacas minuta]